MDDARELALRDPELVDEIRMVTDLMVVASLAPGELEQGVIDDVLGVEPVGTFFPSQRRAERSRPPGA
jgi:hypothetical protein